ncbi:MAG: DUF934 domain-containing protein [Steroidobacteraceae bacterium]
MRRIIRQREIVQDGWRYPAANAPAASGDAGPVALTLAEFVAAAPAAAPGSLGLWLEPADAVEQAGALIDRARLVVAHFPKNGEGRGFTQAQLLRQRFGYAGELRAAGAVKRDQLFFLARCGFDAFDLDPAEDPEDALVAFKTFSVAYQPSSDPGQRYGGRRF